MDNTNPAPLASAAVPEALSLPDAFWEALQRLIENAVTQGPASMEDARLVGRYRDALAALAQPRQEAPADRTLRDLLKDALDSVKDYQSGLDFGACDRKLIGRLKFAIDSLAASPAPAALGQAEEFLALLDNSLQRCHLKFDECRRKLDASPHPEREWRLWQAAWLQGRQEKLVEMSAEGMALVPREPTTEMLFAGQHTKQMGIVNMAIYAIEARGFPALEGLGKTGETSALAEAYRAMIAAAPGAAAPTGKAEGEASHG